MKNQVHIVISDEDVQRRRDLAFRAEIYAKACRERALEYAEQADAFTKEAVKLRLDAAQLEKHQRVGIA